jgi:hypothetical protein
MTLPLDKPCACEGLNPKCAKCGGWGYVSEEPIAKGIAKSPKGIAKSLLLSKVAAAKANNSCPICDCIVMARNLDEHIIKFHWEECLLLIS